MNQPQDATGPRPVRAPAPLQDPLFKLDEFANLPTPDLPFPVRQVGDVADLNFERGRRRLPEDAA